MTFERAQQLATEHGCRLKAYWTAFTVTYETINFRYTMPLEDLPNVSEEAFIATITTGRPPQGQRELLGVYQDARRAEELGAIAARFFRRSHSTGKLCVASTDCHLCFKPACDACQMCHTPGCKACKVVCAEAQAAIMHTAQQVVIIPHKKQSRWRCLCSFFSRLEGLWRRWS